MQIGATQIMVTPRAYLKVSIFRYALFIGAPDFVTVVLLIFRVEDTRALGTQPRVWYISPSRYVLLFKIVH
jgi:hypothetical protein